MFEKSLVTFSGGFICTLPKTWCGTPWTSAAFPSAFQVVARLWSCLKTFYTISNNMKYLIIKYTLNKNLQTQGWLKRYGNDIFQKHKWTFRTLCTVYRHLIFNTRITWAVSLVWAKRLTNYSYRVELNKINISISHFVHILQ